MSYGMTLEQYWDGDPYDAVYFRKLNRITIDKLNEQLWLQGMYIYDAICRIAPALQPMSNAQPEPYPDKPYQMANPNPSAEEKQEEEKAQMLNIQAYLESMMARDQENERSDANG